MEKLKLKNWLIVGMILAGVGFPTISNAGQEGSPSIENNCLKNRKESRDIKNTLGRIEDDKTRISLHKKVWKKNRKAKLDPPAHMSKKRLKKATPNLRSHKKHLKTHRKVLKADQKFALKQVKKAKKTISKDLRFAKNDLRRDLRKGNLENLTARSQRIAYLSWKKNNLGEESVSLQRKFKTFLHA